MRISVNLFASAGSDLTRVVRGRGRGDDGENERQEGEGETRFPLAECFVVSLRVQLSGRALEDLSHTLDGGSWPLDEPEAKPRKRNERHEKRSCSIHGPSQR